MDEKTGSKPGSENCNKTNDKHTKEKGNNAWKQIKDTRT